MNTPVKLSTVLAALCLPVVSLAAIAACSDGVSAPSSSSSDLTSDAGSSRPADCQDLDLSTGVPLASQTQIKFDMMGATPVVRTKPDVFTKNGDPALADKLVVYLHGAVGAGTLNIDPDLTKLFTYVPSCLACAALQLDFTKTDAGTSSYAKTFAAVNGIVDIETAITPNQTQGVVRGLELRELYTDATGARKLLPGGQCYWVAEQPFDTRREKGCRPFQENAGCAEGQYCMPTNAIGTDGQCAATGAKKLGDTCTVNVSGDAPSWDSDCATGLRCFKDSETMETVATCKQICDELAPTNACPTGSTCGGGYSLCIPNQVLVDHSGLDFAAIGEACTQKAPGGGWAQYCGGEGKKRGTCVDQDGFGVGKHARCETLFVSAATEVPPGHLPGYVGYKGVNDQSTLWSYVP